jgi:hypothetical protein
MSLVIRAAEPGEEEVALRLRRLADGVGRFVKMP